jgi:hypothetical protein
LKEPKLKRYLNAITATKQTRSGPTLSSNRTSLSYDLNPKRNVACAYYMWGSALCKHQISMLDKKPALSCEEKWVLRMACDQNGIRREGLYLALTTFPASSKLRGAQPRLWLWEHFVTAREHRNGQYSRKDAKRWEFEKERIKITPNTFPALIFLLSISFLLPNILIDPRAELSCQCSVVSSETISKINFRFSIEKAYRFCADDIRIGAIEVSAMHSCTRTLIDRSMYLASCQNVALPHEWTHFVGWVRERNSKRSIEWLQLR